MTSMWTASFRLSKPVTVGGESSRVMSTAFDIDSTPSLISPSFDRMVGGSSPLNTGVRMRDAMPRNTGPSMNTCSIARGPWHDSKSRRERLGREGRGKKSLLLL